MKTLAEYPDLLTMSEVADLFRSTAANRSRAGRNICATHRIAVVQGHRPGIWLAPKWALAAVIGTPAQEAS